jgi:hypothetical protein
VRRQFIEAAIYQSGISLKRQFIEAAIHRSSNSSKQQFIEAAIHQSSNSLNGLFIKASLLEASNKGSWGKTNRRQSSYFLNKFGSRRPRKILLAVLKIR